MRPDAAKINSIMDNARKFAGNQTPSRKRVRTAMSEPTEAHPVSVSELIETEEYNPPIKKEK